MANVFAKSLVWLDKAHADSKKDYHLEKIKGLNLKTLEMLSI